MAMPGKGPNVAMNAQHGIMQKRSGVNQSRDRSSTGFNSNSGVFNRPQSATQKRKADGS